MLSEVHRDTRGILDLNTQTRPSRDLCGDCHVSVRDDDVLLFRSIHQLISVSLHTIHSHVDLCISLSHENMSTEKYTHRWCLNRHRRTHALDGICHDHRKNIYSRASLYRLNTARCRDTHMAMDMENVCSAV